MIGGVKMADVSCDTNGGLFKSILQGEAARLGFDADAAWERYLILSRNHGRITRTTHVMWVLEEAVNRGWLKEADIEGTPSLSQDSPSEVFFNAGEETNVFSVVKGGSEGYVIEWKISLGEECVTRLFFKTCGHKLDAVEKLGMLAGRLAWLCNTIY